MSSRLNLRLIGAKLHEQLLAGSSLVVTSELAETFVPLLVKSLRREYFNVKDITLIESAVTDAVMSYFAHPDRYNPEKSALFTYLRLRAASNLLNLLSAEKSHKFVELEAPDSVNETEGDDIEESLIKREVNDRVIRQIREILPDPVDQELASLMINGIRDTSSFAEKLNILHCDPEEQARIVKRHKDRIKASLKRKYQRESK
jgi:RNA polymerase sigma-70 factor, ECF subfamily